MNNATLLRIEDRRPPTENYIDDEDNLRNRVVALIQDVCKRGNSVLASNDSHPWYLHLDNVTTADYDPVRQRCAEVAATLQIAPAQSTVLLAPAVIRFA